MYFDITIEKSNKAEFVDRLNAFNLKMAEYSCSCSVISSTEDSEVKELENLTIRADFNRSNLKGIDVDFLGVIDCTNSGGNIYNGFTFDVHSFIDKLYCFECGKKINRSKYLVFKRKEVEVVTSEKDLILLGSICAKKYFDFSVESAIRKLSWFFEESEEVQELKTDRIGFMSSCYSLADIFYYSSRARQNKYNYCSNGVTKEIVVGLITDGSFPISNYSRMKYREKYPDIELQYTFEDYKNWLVENYSKEKIISDFDNNISVAIFGASDTPMEYIRKKYSGIVIYSVYAFYMAMNKEQKHQERIEEQKKIALTSDYIGNVKDKIELNLTFTKQFNYESQYGDIYIYLFKDSSGNVFKWSTSTCCPIVRTDKNGHNHYFGLEENVVYSVKGTIKEHSEYNGVKQNVLTRCKIKTIEN